jgi:hypothetical protein
MEYAAENAIENQINSEINRILWTQYYNHEDFSEIFS